MPYIISTEKMNKLGNEVAKRVFPFCDSIDGVSKDPKVPPKFIGSGILIKDDDDTFILTAQHVAKSLLQYDYIFHGVNNKGKSVPAQQSWVGCPINESDIAIIRCFHEFFESGTKDFLDINQIRETSLENALLFCQGFPGEEQVSIPFLNIVESHSLPFIGKFRGYSLNQNKEPIKFIIEYPSDINPRGMSGSPVWNLNLHNVPKFEDWDYDQITFAGIAQRWIKDSKVLLVTRSSLISKFLPGMIKEYNRLFPRTDR